MKIIRFYLNVRLCHSGSTIEIPKKIYRTNTSVLKALAGTVQKDHLFQRNIIDDPFITHNFLNNMDAKYMAAESGRNAARMVFERNKNVFLTTAKEEPTVYSLRPTIDVDIIRKKVEEGKMSQEEGLLKLIYLKKTEEAFEFFREGESNFSQSVIISLLELLCYTCSGTFTHYKAWTDNNSAELLFSTIKDKTSEMYEAMIYGSSNGRNSERALELKKEMENNSLKIKNISTYNSLIRYSNSKVNQESFESFIINILNDINKNGLYPNVETFNDIFWACIKRNCYNFCKSVEKEMDYLSIEPNLTTYYLKTKLSLLPLRSVVDELWKRKQYIDYEEIQDMRDLHLFVYLMGRAKIEEDLDSMVKIHKLVISGGRYHLIDRNNSFAYFNYLIGGILFLSKDLNLILDIIRPYLFQNIIRPIDLFKIAGLMSEQPDYRPYLDKVLLMSTYSRATKFDNKTFCAVCNMVLSLDDIDIELKNKLQRTMRCIIDNLAASGLYNVPDDEVLNMIVDVLIKIEADDIIIAFMNYLISSERLKMLYAFKCCEFYFTQNQIDKLMMLIQKINEEMETRTLHPSDRKEFTFLIEKYKTVYADALMKYGYNEVTVNEEAQMLTNILHRTE